MPVAVGAPHCIIQVYKVVGPLFVCGFELTTLQALHIQLKSSSHTNWLRKDVFDCRSDFSGRPQIGL